MQQSKRTSLVVTAAGLLAVALFVILLRVLNRSDIGVDNATNSTPLATPIKSPGPIPTPLLPATIAVSSPNELSTPPIIDYAQHLPKFTPGVQAPMTVSSIDPLQARSHWITALTVDQRGRWWIGTEGQGVLCYDPAKQHGRRWMHFNHRNFAPDNVYALACDGMDRIWAGSMRHGVCVYNGKTWQDYDLIAGQGYGRATGIGYELPNPGTPGAHWQAIIDPNMPTTARVGPLGQRIFGIDVSPLDGDAWIATAKGLTRYRIHKNTWQYYTQANGLPADQLSCLAFAPDGTLFVGTQCHGIAVSLPQDHYKTWIHISGPITPPISAWGVGLPDDRINAITVVPRNFHGGQLTYRVYVGTDSGLAIGEDNGQLWQYIRGRNYILKIKGLWHVPPHWTAPPLGVRHNLLLSDYVTSLATDADGNIWVGHRTGGFEILNQHNERIFPTANSAYNSTAHSFVASMAPLPNGGMLVGGYESGLFQVRIKLPQGAVAAFRPAIKPTIFPPLPAGARAPTALTLNKLLSQVKTGAGRPCAVASLGADWRMEGDWLGHYGVAYAKLCDGGPNFQTSEDQFFGGLGTARIDREASPHQTRLGDMRYYVAWYHSQSRRTLYDPDMAQRVEGEWNDADGYYPRFFDGPDMWLRAQIPKGLYRLSFYFHNKDGETNKNDLRDYCVEIYPKGASPARAWAGEQPLAHNRVLQFWGGMYCCFLIKGPGTYQVRLKRNYSFWMTVAGMFLDRIARPKDDIGYNNLDGLPLSSYRPAKAPVASVFATSAACRLWQRLNAPDAYSRTDIARQWPDRIFAYRYAAAHHFPAVLLRRWRWKLDIWLPSDRRAFDQAIAAIPAPTPPGTLGQ
ncbi:MAG: ligand-binding sensor domain-containing protein [Phycisphaerae bacterium]